MNESDDILAGMDEWEEQLTPVYFRFDLGLPHYKTWTIDYLRDNDVYTKHYKSVMIDAIKSRKMIQCRALFSDSSVFLSVNEKDVIK